MLLFVVLFVCLTSLDAGRWDWADKWAIDLSMKHGQPDNEGWFYGASFDRLGEMIA